MVSTLSKLLRSEGVVGLPGIDVYLFGSLLSADTPQDIDVLLVYDPSRITVTQAIPIRQRLREAILKFTEIPADVVLLSVPELEQTQFLKKINATHVDQPCS